MVYLPEKARWAYLLNMPEGADIGKALNEAMTEIEKENEDLRGILPKSEYQELDNLVLGQLLRFEHPADAVVSRYFREHRQLGH